ncbi:methyltransferase [Paenibacillus yonginensis]|uniref:Methyltransferase n=1 Tax=Paenibacillus yonginensis TaxID=1462996 RepID=A0A1B1MX75_9BACL|nr:O-methyltransferase [Paenibacillus yonginensis]ANS73791.1 methyltransferase [Paenibacillus yonginensis]
MGWQKLWTQVDGYMADRLVAEDEVLKRVWQNNREAGLPEIDVAPNQGQLLQLLVRMQGAQRILEIGTLGGYSTVWMARALPEDGELVTLEYDPHHAEVAQQNLELAGVSDKVTIRVGAALDELAKMEQERAGDFDFIFIDADKPNNPGYLEWALKFSHPGTVIVGDNVVRGGEILNPNSEDPRVRGVQNFFDMLAKEPRVTATALQTVGIKGYDGFMMGIVNG